MLLAKTPGVEIAGISTVFGNPPLTVTDRTPRGLVAMLEREGGTIAPVYAGRQVRWAKSARFLQSRPWGRCRRRWQTGR